MSFPNGSQAISSAGPKWLYDLPEELLMNIASRLTFKELNRLHTVSATLAKSLFKNGYMKHENSFFPFACRVLQSANQRCLTFKEYRICNTRVHQTPYKIMEDGTKVKQSKCIDIPAYAAYKTQKVLREKNSLFSSITHLDWREGCCREDNPKNKTILTPKGSFILYWKALKGLEKFNVQRLMLRLYPQDQEQSSSNYKDFAFSGQSLAAIKKIVSEACSEKRSDKIKKKEFKRRLQREVLTLGLLAHLGLLSPNRTEE